MKMARKNPGRFASVIRRLYPRIDRSRHPYRHPEVLAVLHGEPRRMGHKRKRPSFETPRKRAALRMTVVYVAGEYRLFLCRRLPCIRDGLIELRHGQRARHPEFSDDEG